MLACVLSSQSTSTAFDRCHVSCSALSRRAIGSNSTCICTYLFTCTNRILVTNICPDIRCFSQESWHFTQFAKSVPLSSAIVSMGLAAFMFGVYTWSTAHFRELHARHFIQRSERRA